ncbi:uncharacterized protein [Nicotiana sylvestris]|uniref:uncharacterized protein n=1 Tax=Nicotiana sylvestris TaxID=4096 RepID=UPI00388C8506
MHMRLPPSGEAEALEPGMNKKRKSRAAITRLDGTATLTSGSNLDIEGEDDDGSPLRRRTRSSARDLQAPRSEAAESGTAGSGQANEPRVLEEDTDVASNRMAGFGVASARRTVGIDPEGSELGAFQECGLPLGEIGKPNDFISNFPVLSGELRDLERMIGITAGTPPKGGRFYCQHFYGIIDRADLDISRAVKVAEKSMQQEMYDHAILRLRKERFCHEKERKNISSKLQDLEAHSARGDKELGELRSALEVAIRENAALASQVEQSDSQISQLKAEIFGMKERSEIVAGESVTSRDLLINTRREIITLAAAKSEAERDAATCKEDATTMHTMVYDMSMAFDRLKAGLLHCEAPLRDARDREQSLKLLCAAKESELVSLRREVDRSRAREALLEKQLKNKADELEQFWGEVGKAKCEFIELQAHVNAHYEAK